MNKLGLLLALLALTGCASTKDFVARHPVITTIAVTTVMFAAVSLAKGHNHDSGNAPIDYPMSTPLIGPPDFTTQPINCQQVDCH